MKSGTPYGVESRTGGPERTEKTERTEGRSTALVDDSRALRFAIIGAGMAGILSAIKLKDAGLTDFTVYEKADRVGGTWRENTYPGLACDVPSHLYSYSFAPTPEWSHRFSPGDEIQGYFERGAHEHDIERQIRCGDAGTSCRLDGGTSHNATPGRHRDDGHVCIPASGGRRRAGDAADRRAGPGEPRPGRARPRARCGWSQRLRGGVQADAPLAPLLRRHPAAERRARHRRQRPRRSRGREGSRRPVARAR